jgi:hypothetical protein
LPPGYLEHLASGERDEALAAVLSVWSPIRTLDPFWGNFRVGGDPAGIVGDEDFSASHAPILGDHVKSGHT